jgi:Glycosyl transferase family 2
VNEPSRTLPLGNEPRITIALPTYNRPETTRAALASALAQTYPAHEIIVSDDTPDDSVERVVAAAPPGRVIYIANRPALGIPDKFNDVIRRSTGDWMVFLGDDDIFAPDLLAHVAQAIRTHPNCAIVHTRSRMVDPHGRFIAEDAVSDALLSSAEFLHALYQYWHRMRVTITGFFFPLEMMRQIGGFRQTFNTGYYNDTLAWTELALRGPCCLIGKPLVTLTEWPVKIVQAKPRDGFAELEARKSIALLIAQLVNEAISRAVTPSERSALQAALEHALRFVAADTRAAIRSIATKLALECTDNTKLQEFEAFLAKARTLEQPYVQTHGLGTFLSAMDSVLRLPKPVSSFAINALRALPALSERLRRGSWRLGAGG